MNLSEMYEAYDGLMREYNEYVVYTKPLVEINNGKIVSGSKYIVIAPAAVLDQLEKEMSEHRAIMQELHLAKNKTTDAEELEKLAAFQDLEVERHESTLKELSEKYDTAIKLLSKYDENRAVRVSSRTGSSYRLNYYDNEKEKRSHVSINNLVMIDSDISTMSLDNTAKRKKRNDTKQPIIELNTISIYEPLEISYDEYMSNRKH